MNIDLDEKIAPRVAGYAWAIQQGMNIELNELESFSAHAAFISGTEAEEDHEKKMESLRLWEIGVEQSHHLLREDSYISVAEAAERACCDISYIKAEILRYQKSGGEKGLYAQKFGRGRTSAYAIHPDDFRRWIENPRRGTRSK